LRVAELYAHYIVIEVYSFEILFHYDFSLCMDHDLYPIQAGWSAGLPKGISFHRPAAHSKVVHGGQWSLRKEWTQQRLD
jgi:hypothetical protein